MIGWSHKKQLTRQPETEQKLKFSTNCEWNKVELTAVPSCRNASSNSHLADDDFDFSEAVNTQQKLTQLLITERCFTVAIGTSFIIILTDITSTAIGSMKLRVCAIHL